MKPGERFEAITTTADLLAQRDLSWTMLDTLFEQFGFYVWSDEWEGNDKRDYAFAVLRNKHAPAEALPELYEYLTAPTASASLVGAAPWSDNQLRLFLSHSSKDRELVGAVSKLLAREGIEAFVAHRDIRPGSEWERVIEAALQTCDALAAFLTDDFFTSRWTEQEVGYAYARRVPLLGIRLPHDPGGFMGKYQGLAITVDRTPEAIAKALLDSLLAHDATKETLEEARVGLTATDPAAEGATRDLVTKFALSGSFREAEDNWRALQSAPVWTHELLDEVEKAEQTNGQISGAWKIPDGAVALYVRNERHKLDNPPVPEPVPVAAPDWDDDIPF